MNSHVGCNVHWPSAQHLDWVGAAGMTMGRIDVKWLKTETRQGDYDWTLLDRIIDDMIARGLAIYATIDGIPSWANEGGGEYTLPSDPEVWHGFVRAVAHRYGTKIHIYSLLNEPNMHILRDDPQGYIHRILMPVLGSIRTYAPASRIACPDIAMEGHWQSWLREVLKYHQFFDIISVHCYQDDGREVLKRLGGPISWWEARLKPQLKPTLLDLMREAGCEGKSVMLSETGWQSHHVGEEGQASRIDQLLEVLPQYPWIEACLLYEIQDNSGYDYGLFREDGTPKPAYQVIQQRSGGSLA